MDRNSVDWRGYWPAAPTPFSAEGAIDIGAIEALMEHYSTSNVHGVLVNGSTGEWWAMSPDERRKVAEVAIKTVNGRFPVVVGCTTFTADGVLELAQHAETLGASGVLATPPPYAALTQEEIVAFYTQISAGSECPIMAYNWPRGTAVDITLDSAHQIADLPNVVAIKNSTANWSSVVGFIDELGDQVRIFASLINAPGLAIIRTLGGDGYIDGGGIGAPHAVPFFEACWDERWTDAMGYARRYWMLTGGWINPDFSGRYGAPAAQLKTAMRILGQPGGHVRPPLLATDSEQNITEIAQLLRDAHLL